MKNIAKFLFSLLFIFVLAFPVFSQTNKLNQEINSFELFWPVAAGKTMDDPLYKLKLFKEKIRGMLIFGEIQKADYALFLSTKRVVEAEKLINSGQTDFAKITLDRMLEQLTIVSANIVNKEGLQKNKIDEFNIRLDNLELFVNWLIFKNENLNDRLNPILQKIEEVNKNI